MRTLTALAVGIFMTAMTALTGPVRAEQAVSDDASLSALFTAISAQDWGRARALAKALDATGDNGDIMSAYVMAAQLTAQGQCKLALKMSGAIIHVSPLFLPAYDLAASCLQSDDRAAEAAALYRKAANAVQRGADHDRLVARANAIDPARKWRFSIDGNVAPSTNLNRGTDETTIKGLPISDVSKAKSGVAISASVEAEKPIFVSPRLRAAVSLRVGASYNTITGGYVPSIRTAFSVTRLVSQRTSLSFKPYVEVGFAETDYLYTRPGFQASINHRVSPDLTVGADADVSHFVFEDGKRDGISANLTLRASKLVTENDIVAAQVWVNVEDRELKSMNSVGVGGEIELEHRFRNGLITSGAIGGHYRKYEGLAPLSFERQEDYAAFARLGISHQKVKIGKIRPELAYTATRQWSNDAFSRHTAHDVGIRFKATF